MSWYKDPLFIVAIAIVFSLDQVTKAVVRHSLLLYDSFPREGVIRITHTFNTGSAFGLFPDQTLFLILASLAGIGIILIVYRSHPFSSFPLRLSLGMQLGGAAGNLIDRLRTGQVTDFIELGFWPVFNIADASIVIGIVIIGYVFLFARRGRTRPSPAGYSLNNEDGISSVADPRTGGTGWSEEALPENLELFADHGCPICDSTMKEVPGGWRCSGCGVKEWVEDRESS